jgi:hypothetical protein
MKKKKINELSGSNRYTAYLTDFSEELLDLNIRVSKHEPTFKIKSLNWDLSSFVVVPNTTVTNSGLTNYFFDREREFFKYFGRENAMCLDGCVDWYTDVLGGDETEEDLQLKLDTFLGKIAMKEDRLTEYLRN